MPHLRKAFPSDPCHQKLGWRNVKRQHFTPDELVRCGVVSASFFANRTNGASAGGDGSRWTYYLHGEAEGGEAAAGGKPKK